MCYESLSDFEAEECAARIWELLEPIIEESKIFDWTVAIELDGEVITQLIIDDEAVGSMISTELDAYTTRSMRMLTRELSEYVAAKAMEFASRKLFERTVECKDDSEPAGLKAASSEEALDEFIRKIEAKAKVSIVRPKETLADYICNDTLRTELEEIKDFVERRADYLVLGIRLPKGILFKGVPGTGKTYAARCIAGSVDCYFMSCTASSLQGMYVGSGAENIKNVFGCAKALFERTSKPVIIFLDELDSFGSRESHGGNAGSEEDRTLNQLLAEMSGFEDSEGIIVMGATNYPERIDDALMRSGRFSRQITIDLPDEIECIELVKYYFAKLKLERDLDCGDADVAALSVGLTPADIAEMVNESAILAMRESTDTVTLSHVNEAINKVITKNIRKPDKSHEFHRLVAVHEAGHVLADYIYRGSCAIKVTNYSYGDAGGFTQSQYKHDEIITKEEFKNNVMVKLGGRAAEEVVLGEVSTGASEDFARAVRSIRAYYETYHFEAYDVDKLDQTVLDTLHSWYDECVKEFSETKVKTQLLNLQTAIISQRVLYAKDICRVLT